MPEKALEGQFSEDLVPPELIRVKASAGAGKTYHLAIRYITLLKRMGKPEGNKLMRIVAITFTNKAAEEMKGRILGFLKEIALGNSERSIALTKETGLSPKEAMEWLDTILGNYSYFQVRTIDSLLVSILTALSFHLGLRPEREILFEEKEIVRQAFDRLLMEIPYLNHVRDLWDRVLGLYLSIDQGKGFYPEKNLFEKILKLYQKAKDIEPDQDRSFEDFERELEMAKRNFGNAWERFLVILGEYKNYLNKSLTRDLDRDPDILRLSERKILINELEGILNSEGRARLSSKAKGDIEKARQEVRTALNELILKQSQMTYYRPMGYVEFLSHLGQEVQEICKKEGLLLGSEAWTDYVLKAIGEDRSALLIYPYFVERFQHFLFDEFQDTSRKQWEALYPLIDEGLSTGGSLFVVGDLKQGIYGWRGGDPSLFDSLLDGTMFPSVDCYREEELTKNYRSSHELVNFFNNISKYLSDPTLVSSIIADVALGKDCPKPIKDHLSREVSKVFSSTGQEAARKDEGNCAIIVKAIWYAQKEHLRAVAYPDLINHIRSEWDYAKKEGRGGGIAVLVRTNAQAEEISSMLMNASIPVITENALRIRTSPLVKGIICFLHYLHDQEDEVSVYGFLNSGILNLGFNSEEGLAINWLNGKRYKHRLEEISKELKPLVSERGPYETIQGLINLSGLWDRLDMDFPGQRPFLERLLEVTHEFELQEGANLSNYLEFWNKGSLEERVGLPEAIDAVRVMTVHKAKGLEFPVVFVPFTDWAPDTREVIKNFNNRIVHLSRPMPKEVEEFMYQQRAKEVQEILNLFYVAITRAKNRLYLYLTIPRKGKPLSYWIYEILSKYVLFPIEVLDSEKQVIIDDLSQYNGKEEM